MKTKITCADALKQWRKWAETVGLAPNTVSCYHTYISAFIEAHGLASKSPRVIDETHIDQFVNTADTAKAATRNSRLNAIQSFFLVCVAKAFTTQNPAALVRVKWHRLTFDQKEKKPRVPFTDTQLETLRTQPDPFWCVASILADEFGLRLGDVASLEWASFSKPGKIVVWTDKHDRRIELDLPDHIAETINALPKEHPVYVFPEQHATVKNPDLRAKLSTYFARVLKREGIEGRSFHCFRHTFASRHRRLGESVDEIRLKLGHANATTTRRIHSLVTRVFQSNNLPFMVLKFLALVLLLGLIGASGACLHGPLGGASGDAAFGLGFLLLTHLAAACLLTGIFFVREDRT